MARPRLIAALGARPPGRPRSDHQRRDLFGRQRSRPGGDRVQVRRANGRLDPELGEKIEIIPSTKTMIGRRTGSVYRAVSARGGTKHGFSPSWSFTTSWRRPRAAILYDVLDTSFGARDEPLFIAISTQSERPRAHLFEARSTTGFAGPIRRSFATSTPPTRIATSTTRSNGPRPIRRLAYSATARTWRRRSARPCACRRKSPRSATCF